MYTFTLSFIVIFILFRVKFVSGEGEYSLIDNKYYSTRISLRRRQCNEDKQYNYVRTLL